MDEDFDFVLKKAKLDRQTKKPYLADLFSKPNQNMHTINERKPVLNMQNGLNMDNSKYL